MRFDALILMVVVAIVAATEVGTVYHYVLPWFDALNRVLASLPAG